MLNDASDAGPSVASVEGVSAGRGLYMGYESRWIGY